VLKHASSSGVKAPIHGLLDLGQVSAVSMPLPPPNSLFYACQFAPAFGGLVVNETWSDLQPGFENQTIDTQNIDAALAMVALYNATAANPIGVRLRVWQGINAPQWAKNIDGPIDICDNNGPVTPAPQTPTPHPDETPTPCPATQTATDVRTVGGFWTAPYQAAWANVQMQLAQKYDSNPLVSEISVTSCSSLTDEPFVQPEDGWSVARLFGASPPYSNAAYQACLKNALSAYSVWHATIVDDIFNPFKEIAIKPPYADNLDFTKSVMRDCQALGARCLLNNETLGKFGATPPPADATPSPQEQDAANYFAMWRYMQHLHAAGIEVSFQTAAPPELYLAGGNDNLAGWSIAINLARQFRAGSLELWPPEHPIPPCVTAAGWYRGYACFPRKTVIGWSREVLRNP
jgi:hypothetical protein